MNAYDEGCLQDFTHQRIIYENVEIRAYVWVIGFNNMD